MQVYIFYNLVQAIEKNTRIKTRQKWKSAII